MCECIKSSRRTWEGDDCPTCRTALDLSKPVQTRDGKPVRILCTDRKYSSPIVGLVPLNNNIEEVRSWNAFGRYFPNSSRPHSLDLVNAPEKISGWVNVYENKRTGLCRMRDLHLTKEHAIACRDTYHNEVCLGTIYINQTEIQK